jgi:hypothetical protein
MKSAAGVAFAVVPPFSDLAVICWDWCGIRLGIRLGIGIGSGIRLRIWGWTGVSFLEADDHDGVI